MGTADDKVVVRFAPSPTGPFHVGSARTALFNWMWARRCGGDFLLRIEDTDSARSTKDSLDNILDNMRLLGLDWDGDIYYSSAHRDDHVAAARSLVDAGLAYHCDCTRADIDDRGVAVGSGYDGHCRDRDVPANGALVRLRNPGGTITFVDAVLGTNTTNAATFGDFPLVKSNGDPLFLLGNVYDDAAMGVNWVIRGADHLPNNPKYVLVWDALRAAGVFDLDHPNFAHLPLIVGPSGKKLSKRRDKVAVDTFLDDLGVLPSALITYLSNLGWGAPDGMDKLPVADLVPYFDVHRVGTSNAVMDVDKLKAVNAHHLNRLWDTDPKAFADTVTRYLDVDWDLTAHPDLLADLPSRIATLADARDLLTPIFDDVPPDDRATSKWLTGNPAAAGLLGGFLSATVDRDWDADTLHAICSDLATANDLGLMKATMPIRVAALRTDKGMPLFTALAALGRSRATDRMELALRRLGEADAGK